VQQFESPDGRPGELDPAADTLVLDLPGELRHGAYRSIREWFPGRVVVLLVPGERDRSFDGDQACRVLFRPFQLDDLIRELVVPPRAGRRRGAAPSGRLQASQRAAAAPDPAASGPPARPSAGTAPPPSTPAGTTARPSGPSAGTAPPPSGPTAGTAPPSSGSPAGTTGRPSDPPAGTAPPPPGTAGRPSGLPAGTAPPSSGPPAGTTARPPGPTAGTAPPPPGTAGRPSGLPAGAASPPPSGTTGRPSGPPAGTAPPPPGTTGRPPDPRAGAASPPPGPPAGATGLPPGLPAGTAPPPPGTAAPPGPRAGAAPSGPPGGPWAGATPPPSPSPDVPRTRFPGGVDRPSRTASPGAPEKVRPDELDAAGARPPLLFDWFASHGRRMDEAVADPPDNGTTGPTRGAPTPAPQRGQSPGPTQDPSAIADLGRPTEPWRPIGRTEERPVAADPARPPDLRRPAAAPEAPAAKEPARRVDPGPPPGSAEAPPGPPDPGRPAEQRRPPAEPRRPTGSAEAAGPGRPAQQPPSSRAADLPSRLAAERGRDQPAGAAAVGEELPKRVVDLRTGLPRRRARGRSEDEREVERPPAAAEPVPATPAPATAVPGTVRVVAGQPGERVRAPAPRGWGGPPPAFARLLLALLLGSLAVLVSGLFSTRSPDIGAGEAAIAQVARSAAGGSGIAWRGQPVLDQPPLALVAHAGWLRASGRAGDELVQTVQQARLSSSGFRGLATALLVLLVLALTERRRDTLLRFAIASAAGLVAALDPVLAGAGRVLTVESVGLAAGLAALLLAWLLHERRAAVFVPAVGLASGAALLADGRTVVLLLVPLGFALLVRGWQGVDGLAGRALAAVAVGLGFWVAFAAWVLRAPGAAGLGQRLERLAALTHLTGSDRPLPLSRPLELSLPRDLATLAVLALAVPALLAVWRRGERAGRFLAAWNLAGLAAGTVLAAAGALDKSWLAYLVPGAVAAVALGLGAFRDLLAGQGASARRAATVTVSLVVLALAVAGGRGWDGRYGHADDAVAQMATLVAARTPACSAVNAGDPADPDLFAVGTRRVTQFPDGPAALSGGVRYFLLRGGQSAGGLAAWLGANGRRVASVASPSLGRVQLWEVQQPSSSRIADQRRVGGGVFENTVGSACGGFAVLDGGGARFWSGYQAIGGKAVAGRVLSRPYRDGLRTAQAFDSLVLGSVPDPQGGQPLARPVDLLMRLSRQAPALLAAAQLPRAETAPPPSILQRRRLLAEPSIARFYLGVEPGAANPAVWQLAAARFGAPVSPPRHVPGGLVRQAFEDVVMEADAQGAVRLAPLGPLAVRAGIVPAAALRPEPVTGLPPPGSRYPAVRDRDLSLYLAAALVLWLLLTIALAVGAGLRRKGAPALVVPGLAPPRPASPGYPPTTSSARYPGDAAGPGHPATGPGHPTADPGNPTAGPGHPATGPGHPTASPGHPAAGPGNPTAGSGHPATGPGLSTGSGHPTAGPGQPAAGSGRAGHGPRPATTGEERTT
jgi:4-amino-4-deoxy-L-arabinose transferase-like glycosyltransferase